MARSPISTQLVSLRASRYHGVTRLQAILRFARKL